MTQCDRTSARTAVLAAALAGLALTACAASAQDGVPPASPPPAAKQTDASPEALGAPQRCIALNQIQQSTVLDDQTILFRLHGNKHYRNRLPYRCPQLGFEERFLIKTSINQLCSTDIITVLTSMGGGLREGASCGLGQFEPVAPPNRSASPSARTEPNR